MKFYEIIRGVDLNRNWGYKWGTVSLLDNPQVKYYFKNIIIKKGYFDYILNSLKQNRLYNKETIAALNYEIYTTTVFHTSLPFYLI